MLVNHSLLGHLQLVGDFLKRTNLTLNYSKQMIIKIIIKFILKIYFKNYYKNYYKNYIKII